MIKWFNQKVLEPVSGLIKQGLSPSSLALGLACGAVMGVVPLIGISTTCCVILAFVLRLNQVAIQLANYLVYPLQIILLVPFVRAGELILGLESISVSPSELAEFFSNDFLGAIKVYGKAILVGCLAWALASLPIIFVLKLLFEKLLHRYASSMTRLEAE